jgi:3-oxoacyl-[acyl-carrier protein] reductase
MEFENKSVIVTGASRGIGRGIALGFGRAKASVLVNYLKQSAAAEEVVSSIRSMGGRAFSYRADTSDPAQVEAMAKHAEEQFGPVDILVNNAGIPGPFAHLVNTNLEEWDRVIAVNLRGYFLCSRAVLPSMLERGKGVIVNVSSLYGLRGEPNNGAYGATKAGINLFTQTLALEVAPKVRVNAICPGHMMTDQNWDEIRTWAAERGTSFEYERDQLWARIPLKRPGNDEDMANIVLFLASDASSYITGQAIVIDGGFHLL